MRKSKAKNLTLAEAGDFFDTHDLFDSGGATEVMDLRIRIPKRKYVGIDVSIFRKIREAARKAHRTEDSLIQEWLREKVSQTVVKNVKLWYDPEGDFLEVMFEKKAGYFKETENDHVMEKVDQDGNVIGFPILKISALKDRPLDVALV